MILVRLRSSKDGKIRFTSHRDVARIWERTLRIAQVPLVYSEGFSPRPRLAFGLALPTGAESDDEYIDVQIDDSSGLDFSLTDLPALLSAALPVGLEVTDLAIIERGAPSLQQDVTSCVWNINVSEAIDIVQDWSDRVNTAPSLVVSRERKGKVVTDDLRPQILSLEVIGASDTGGSVLRAELGTKPRSLRPAELLQALEPHLTEVRLRRCQQFIERDGARLEPLEVGAAPQSDRVDLDPVVAQTVTVAP